MSIALCDFLQFIFNGSATRKTKENEGHGMIVAMTLASNQREDSFRLLGNDVFEDAVELPALFLCEFDCRLTDSVRH